MTHVQLEKWMGLQERPWMEKNEQLQNDLQKNTCYPVWFFGLSFAVGHAACHFVANMLVHPDLVFQFVVVTF